MLFLSIIFLFGSVTTSASSSGSDDETFTTIQTILFPAILSCLTNKDCPSGDFCHHTTGECRSGSHYGAPCVIDDQCLDHNTRCSYGICECNMFSRYLRGECKPHKYCYSDSDCSEEKQCLYYECRNTSPESSFKRYTPPSFILCLIVLVSFVLMVPCFVLLIFYIKKRGEIRQWVGGWNSQTRSFGPLHRSHVNLVTHEPEFSEFTPSPEYDPPPPYTPSMHPLCQPGIHETGLINFAANASDEIIENQEPPPSFGSVAEAVPNNVS